MEEENEKYYAVFKIIAISLINIIVGFFVIFFIGLSRVNAATWSGVYDKSDVTNSTNGNNEGTSTYAYYGSSWGQTSPILPTIPSSYLFKTNLNQLGLGVIQTGDFKQNTQYEFEISFKAQIGIWGPSATSWAMGGNVLLGNMAGVQQNVSNRSFTRTNLRTTTRKWFGKTIEVNEALYTLSGTFTASMNQTRISFLFPNNTASNEYNGIWYQDIQISINSLNTDKTNGDIINNNNSNTNKIINNQNQNNQELMEKQEELSQAEIEAIQQANLDTIDAIDKTFNVCENNIINNSNGKDFGALLDNGNILQTEYWKITDYLLIEEKTKINVISTYTGGSNVNLCYYEENKTIISCMKLNTLTNGQQLIIPNNAKYWRTSLPASDTLIVSFNVYGCRNRIDVQVEWEEDNNKTLKDILGGITSSDIDTDELDDFNVVGEDGGIITFVTAPLSSINGILNNTCSDINLPIPFTNKNLTLPCLTPIYQTHFNSILILYQTVITGIISYWIGLSLYKMIHGFTDPDSDRVEVVDL